MRERFTLRNCVVVFVFHGLRNGDVEREQLCFLFNHWKPVTYDKPLNNGNFFCFSDAESQREFYTNPLPLV